MNPKQAKSPKNRLVLKEPLLYSTYKEGESGGFAIANLEYDGKNVIGIRWNGFDKNEKGFPTSHGHPTWFVLPKEIALAYAVSKDFNEKVVKVIQATDETPFIK